MPATIDKLLGRPLLHTHQIGDVIITAGGEIDVNDVVTVQTTPYTATTTATVILVNALSTAITVSMPLASSVAHKIYKIKKIDVSANEVTVDGYSSETIDGDATKSIAYQNSALQLVSNGTGWYII